MKTHSRILLGLLCVLVLSGCVSREQADAKLAKACQAAVNALLEEGQRIDKIKDSNFSPSPEGPDFRHVTINTIMMDGWLETEYSYDCVFQEGFGFMNSGYNASIIQTKIDDRIVGRAGNEILGGTEDLTKVVEAVRKSLYEE